MAEQTPLKRFKRGDYRSKCLLDKVVYWNVGRTRITGIHSSLCVSLTERLTPEKPITNEGSNGNPSNQASFRVLLFCTKYVHKYNFKWRCLSSVETFVKCSRHLRGLRFDKKRQHSNWADWNGVCLSDGSQREGQSPSKPWPLEQLFLHAEFGLVRWKEAYVWPEAAPSPPPGWLHKMRREKDWIQNIN